MSSTVSRTTKTSRTNNIKICPNFLKHLQEGNLTIQYYRKDGSLALIEQTTPTTCSSKTGLCSVYDKKREKYCSFYYKTLLSWSKNKPTEILDLTNDDDEDDDNLIDDPDYVYESEDDDEEFIFDTEDEDDDDNETTKQNKCLKLKK